MNKFFKGLSYQFNRNMGRTDKIIRIVAASGALVAWYFGVVSGIIGTIVAIFAMLLLGTVAVSRCSITYWMDTNTMNEQEKNAINQTRN